MPADLPTDVLDTIRRTWGFDTLRPLQAEAIRAGLDRRDSLVVMPTGGGKSLCYQVPPLVAGRTDVVVSPLISLMKDQVDGLTASGYPAVAVHSGLAAAERREAEAAIASGAVRLIFVAPERLVMPAFQRLLERADVVAFAIDEAHCISHWGHDFRPDYRELRLLVDRFPDASIHAYTATATPRVRADVAEALGLRDPAILVGRFDRENLVYRIIPRLDLRPQLLDVVARHEGQAVIVYTISRKETEALAKHLAARGHRAAHYHAGMDPVTRRNTQDDFAAERIDVIVATVAFGMGIDRSNVRCVVHAAMPKSIEHYQQETGRAGRDGLEAECVLFYSAADVVRWRALFEKEGSRGGPDADPKTRAAGEMLLEHMRRFCAPGRCRHAVLSEYFGQDYPDPSCGACDTCLGENEELEDGTETAQKILSCVARVAQSFGAVHVVDILCGADNERIRRLGHDALTTYGILRGSVKKAVTGQIFQLIDQGLLDRSTGEYPVLRLTDESWEVMRGQRTVHLIPSRGRKKKLKRTRVEVESWEGVDRDLFECLRELRRELASERAVPPYVVFNDAALRDMARRRPSTPLEFLEVHGVGEKRLADYGTAFMDLIAEYGAR